MNGPMPLKRPTMPQDAIEGDNMTDDTSAPPKPTEGEILAGLVAGGLSRREAFTVLCVSMGATSITIAGDDDASPQLEEMRQQVMALQAQAVRRENVIAALMKTMVPAYLTLDDVEQIIKQANKGDR